MTGGDVDEKSSMSLAPDGPAFNKAFPFHLVVDAKLLTILQVGSVSEEASIVCLTYSPAHSLCSP